MTVALAVWLSGAAGIAFTVWITRVGEWHRGVLGGLAWPAMPFLIVGSYLRYVLQRRSRP